MNIGCYKDIGVLTEECNHKMKVTEGKTVPFFCFHLDHLPRAAQFLTLSGSVFLFYIIYGYLQEWIFRQPGLKPHGWYLTLVQFFLYAVFSRIELTRAECHSSIPWGTYIILSVATLASMGLSNASLARLNYPTQVIFKCCKLIPVLMGGFCIQGKHVGILDISAACVMSVGLVLFTLADSSVSPNFDPLGVAMICSALAADAVVSNVQEGAMRRHGAPNAEIIFNSYSLGFLWLLIGLTISGQIFDSARQFSVDPWHSYGGVILFSATGYLGMEAVLTLVRSFGAFVCVSVTSCRKVVSIALSFFFFSKPFTFGYVYSGAIVLAGIYLNLASKRISDEDVYRFFRRFFFDKTRRKSERIASEV